LVTENLRNSFYHCKTNGFWLGLAWLGLAWLGLAWLGLAWLGLAWLGLAWLGLAWLGFVKFLTPFGPKLSRIETYECVLIPIGQPIKPLGFQH
jgi:hypothetical protein